MTFQWILIGTAVLLALVAFVRARRTVKRLERLTESYWELRYEFAQLRARVNRLDPDQATPRASAETPASPDPTAFVPLSSLRRGQP